MRDAGFLLDARASSRWLGASLEWLRGWLRPHYYTAWLIARCTNKQRCAKPLFEIKLAFVCRPCPSARLPVCLCLGVSLALWLSGLLASYKRFVQSRNRASNLAKTELTTPNLLPSEGKPRTHIHAKGSTSRRTLPRKVGYQNLIRMIGCGQTLDGKSKKLDMGLKLPTHPLTGT
jgi:hypothetical protein